MFPNDMFTYDDFLLYTLKFKYRLYNKGKNYLFSISRHLASLFLNFILF